MSLGDEEPFTVVYQISFNVTFRHLCVLALYVTSYTLDTHNPAHRCHMTMKDYTFDYKYSQHGDITIGGIFTVHSTVTRWYRERRSIPNLMCSGIYVREYRHLLAFMFAINEMNSRPDILPNVTLGYHVYDSCGSVNKALKDVLQILSGYTKTAPNFSCMERDTVAAFIGDLHSGTTLQMMQLLNLYGYTQISYGARDTLLSDRKMYPNLFRTVPDNKMQYVAIVKLLERLKWNWVGIITSDDEYGERDLQQLTKHLTNHEICVELKILVSANNFDIISPMLQKATTDIIIICGSTSMTYYKFLFNIAPYYTNKTFILQDSWAQDTELFLFRNSSLVFRCPPLDIYGIKEYFDSVNPSSCPNDPLQEDILISQYRCFSKNQMKNLLIPLTSGYSLRNCNLERITFDLNFPDDMTPYRVFSVVYILAHALHYMYSSYKKSKKLDKINIHTLKYKVSTTHN